MSLEHARPGKAAGIMLYGSLAIGHYLGLTPREVLHLIETKRLPVFWLGRRPAAKRATLDRWLDEQERQTNDDQKRGP